MKSALTVFYFYSKFSAFLLNFCSQVSAKHSLEIIIIIIISVVITIKNKTEWLLL